METRGWGNEVFGTGRRIAEIGKTAGGKTGGDGRDGTIGQFANAAVASIEVDGAIETDRDGGWATDIGLAYRAILVSGSTRDTNGAADGGKGSEIVAVGLGRPDDAELDANRAANANRFAEIIFELHLEGASADFAAVAQEGGGRKRYRAADKDRPAVGVRSERGDFNLSGCDVDVEDGRSVLGSGDRDWQGSVARASRASASGEEGGEAD